MINRQYLNHVESLQLVICTFVMVNMKKSVHNTLYGYLKDKYVIVSYIVYYVYYNKISV